MLKEGKVFRPATVDEWLDCGTIPAWLETSKVIINKENGQTAGDFKNSKIIPPVYLRENVRIEDSEIGPNVSLENGTEVNGSTIKDSIVMPDASVTGSRLTNSTIGIRASVTNAKGEIHVGDDSLVISE